jgi:hypothetical protein
MSTIKQIISDLKDEITHLEQYKDLKEINLQDITPLWWTHRYDGQFICGFCLVSGEILRFQIAYQQDDLQVYILQQPTKEQLSIEKERITDWENMVGFQKTFVGDPGDWTVNDESKCSKEQARKYCSKYFDERCLNYKVELTYSDNLLVGYFVLGL